MLSRKCLQIIYTLYIYIYIPTNLNLSKILNNIVKFFSGIGYGMVLLSGLIAIYYTMVTAWAFHFLFSSMTASLPWRSCTNTWNTKCKLNQFDSNNFKTSQTIFIALVLTKKIEKQSNPKVIMLKHFSFTKCSSGL